MQDFSHQHYVTDLVSHWGVITRYWRLITHRGVITCNLITSNSSHIYIYIIPFFSTDAICQQNNISLNKCVKLEAVVHRRGWVFRVIKLNPWVFILFFPILFVAKQSVVFHSNLPPFFWGGEIQKNPNRLWLCVSCCSKNTGGVFLGWHL